MAAEHPIHWIGAVINDKPDRRGASGLIRKNPRKHPTRRSVVGLGADSLHGHDKRILVMRVVKTTSFRWRLGVKEMLSLIERAKPFCFVSHQIDRLRQTQSRKILGTIFSAALHELKERKGSKAWILSYRSPEEPAKGQNLLMNEQNIQEIAGLIATSER